VLYLAVFQIVTDARKFRLKLAIQQIAGL